MLCNIKCHFERSEKSFFIYQKIPQSLRSFGMTIDIIENEAKAKSCHLERSDSGVKNLILYTCRFLLLAVVGMTIDVIENEAKAKSCHSERSDSGVKNLTLY